jgi:hypothetical protein
MMTFQDFLEHAESLFKRDIPGAGLLPFSKTHIFNLGEDEKIEDGIKEIWEDLKADMAEQVPLPFKDTTCMSMVTASYMEGQPRGWILDRIVEVPIAAGEREYLKNTVLPEGSTPAQHALSGNVRQKFAIIRIEEFSPNVVSWLAYFFGSADGAIMLTAAPSRHLTEKLGGQSSPVLESFLLKESQVVIKQAAAISHPANYIVQVTPGLTPREARRMEQGRERPIRKKPHFIVVDHDILVSMNPKNPSGNHASPVPHERRGHWRKLAEHCRHARLSGREKTWVRPAYVGETEFSDGKNHYEVLMDFGKKSAGAALGEGRA